MKGPKEKAPDRNVSREIETSSVKLAFLGAIGVYQKRVSASGGPDRCGFRPSCSAYGYSAIEEEGPVIGLLMTADRLTRCNIFKEPGPDYTLLPNGKLYDPPSKNLLFAK
jgi:putative component of membrane protein insertase Oxa1/YidC/SpoIIIJ protein YidD